MVSYIVGFLSWFAGIMFLLENTGDPWLEFSTENRQEHGAFTYLDAIWFLMITSSTVGYGYISTSSVLGKVVGLIIVAIAAFANFIPEIVELIGNRPKYAGSYKVRIQSQVFIFRQDF